MEYLKLSLAGIVALFIIAAMLILMACQPQVAQAAAMPTTTPDCQMLADGHEYRLARTIPLSEAIPEQASQISAADGTYDFAQHNTMVVIEEGAQVLLSGSPGGAGFVADDWIGINVQPSNVAREWDFRNDERTQIVAIETPQDITDLFQAGTNYLTLTAKDLMGPVYSSSDYWLLILEPCMAEVASVTPERAVVSSPPTETATTVPTALPTATALPTVTPTTVARAITETTKPTESPPVVDENMPDPPAETELVVEPPATTIERARGPLLWSLGIPLGMLLVGLALWRGREFAPELWHEASQKLAPMRVQLRTRWEEVKAQLEAMQE